MKITYQEEVDSVLKKRARVLGGIAIPPTSKIHARVKQDRFSLLHRIIKRRSVHGKGDPFESRKSISNERPASWLTRRRVVAISQANDKIGGERIRGMGNLSLKMVRTS